MYVKEMYAIIIIKCGNKPKPIMAAIMVMDNGRNGVVIIMNNNNVAEMANMAICNNGVMKMKSNSNNS
jgi:hypothetical protein